jgi:hypothetical protein
VADVRCCTYHDADTRYVVSFEREKTILQAILTDRAPLLKRIIARLIGFWQAQHFDATPGGTDASGQGKNLQNHCQAYRRPDRAHHPSRAAPPRLRDHEAISEG